MPYLQDVTACRASTAAQHASLLLLGVAVGSLVVGIVSDRLGSRRGVMRVYALLYALSLAAVGAARRVAAGGDAGVVLRRWGCSIPGFTLSWTVAKEVNRPEHSGIATSVVNVGIFLGTGVLQPLVGWRARPRPRRGRRGRGWDRGVLLLAGAAALGALATLFVRETRTPQGLKHPAQPCRRPGPAQNNPTMRPAVVDVDAVAAGTFGSPGIVITSPQTMTTNCAPAASRTSRMFSTWSAGAPCSSGSVENEYCVLAMHTGKCP